MIDDNPEPSSPAAPQSTHPSPKAVELFQRALEIEAAGATGKWEPEGRRLEYIDIDIALMRELGRGFWNVSVLQVDENAEGPPAWERNPRNIESWQEAIRLRRALIDAAPRAPYKVYEGDELKGTYATRAEARRRQQQLESQQTAGSQAQRHFIIEDKLGRVVI